MKRILILTAAVALLWTATAAGSGDSDGKHLTAVFSYATFYEPSTGSYFETYLSFDAWNLNFVKAGNQYQATVEALITVSLGDSIVLAKKYDLGSPKIASPDANRFNFIDVQRFALANGIYDLKLQIRDKNGDDEPTVVEQQLALYYDAKRPALSSVQMMSNVTPTETPNILSRSGYDMEPYINDFLPEQVGKINFYCELYNINHETRDQYVYAVSFIEAKETGKVLESTQSVKRLERGPIIPIFSTIDIEDLPSGNYNLVVEIRNHDNDIMLYKRLPFFRSNPQVEAKLNQTPVSMTFAGTLNDEAQLNEYIEALAPIANEVERRDIYDIIHRPGIEEKQRFMYRFWVRREPLNPDGAWLEYKQRIDYVNANFTWPRADFDGTKTKGIHTDRGRVYLQYGAPDFVRDEKNFVSMRYMGGGVTIQGNNNLQPHDVPKQGQIFYLPYQLWRYNNLPGDNANRCFIFWDEFRSGFYKLLHSNARGEVRDSMWERRLCGQQLEENVVGEVGEQFERGY